MQCDGIIAVIIYVDYQCHGGAGRTLLRLRAPAWRDNRPITSLAADIVPVRYRDNHNHFIN